MKRDSSHLEDSGTDPGIDGTYGKRVCAIEGIFPQFGPNVTTVRVVRLSDGAALPAISAQRTGLEICSAYQYAIRPWECAIIKTDIVIKLEDDVYAQIRSGNFRDVDVFPTVLPPSFGGNIAVSLHNLTCRDIIVRRGDVVVLLILQTTRQPLVVEVPNV